MTLDLMLAGLHHLAVFALFAILAAEWTLLRPDLDARALARLGRIDAAYGAAAALALAAGLLRVWFGLKGPVFYLGNPTFWIKLGLFIAVGLVSIVPTLRFIAWRRGLVRDGRLPDAAAIAATRRLVHLQFAVLFALPLLAAALARGVGA